MEEASGLFWLAFFHHPLVVIIDWAMLNKTAPAVISSVSEYYICEELLLMLGTPLFYNVVHFILMIDLRPSRI